jgi:hypothetical protein
MTRAGFSETFVPDVMCRTFRFSLRRALVEVRRHLKLFGFKKERWIWNKKSGHWIRATPFRRSALVHFDVKWIGTPTSLFPRRAPLRAAFSYCAREATSVTDLWLIALCPVGTVFLSCELLTHIVLLQTNIYQTTDREPTFSEILGDESQIGIVIERLILNNTVNVRITSHWGAFRKPSLQRKAISITYFSVCVC